MSNNRSWIERWFASERFAGVLIVIGLVVFVIAAILFMTGGYFQWFGKIDPEVSAQLGDLIGGVVGAIWALAGVILFYRALVTENTRSENESFTNTYFQLLNLYITVLNSIDLNVKQKSGEWKHVTGSDCFINFHNHLRTVWKSQSTFDTIMDIKTVEATIDDLVDSNSTDLVHYCGVVENILTHLNIGGIDNRFSQLRYFTNLISSYEATFLFYYQFSSSCPPKLKELLSQSGIFDRTDIVYLAVEHMQLQNTNNSSSNTYPPPTTPPTSSHGN